MNIFRKNFGKKGRDTNTKINVHSIFNFTSCSSHDFQSSLLGWVNFCLGILLGYCSLFNSFLWPCTVWIWFKDFININCCYMNQFWVNFPWFYDFLYFCDNSFSSCSHISIEVSGCFVEIQVTKDICFLSLNQSKISKDCFLFDVFSIFEYFAVFRLRVNLNFSFSIF